MKLKKTEDQYVTTGLLIKIFVWTILVGSALLFASMFYTIAQQFQYANQDPSMYASLFLSQVLPFVLFTVAYFMNPRRLSFLHRSFEALLLSIAGLTAWSLLTMLLGVLVVPGYDAPNDSFATYQTAGSVVLLVLYVSGLYWLRRTKRWQ